MAINHLSQFSHDAYDVAAKAAHILAQHSKDSIVFSFGKVKEATKKTIDFIKRNWGKLLGFTLAWAAIIALAGSLGGYNIVSLPLTIGLSCGLVFGLLIGIITLEIYKEPGADTVTKSSLTKESSMWGKINKWLNGLDKVTSSIVLSLAVMFIVAAALKFPPVVAFAIWVPIGHHVAITIGLEKNLGSQRSDNTRITDCESKYKSLKELYDNQQAEIRDLSVSMQAEPENIDKQRKFESIVTTNEALNTLINNLKKEIDDLKKESEQKQKT